MGHAFVLGKPVPCRVVSKLMECRWEYRTSGQGCRTTTSDLRDPRAAGRRTDPCRIT